MTTQTPPAVSATDAGAPPAANGADPGIPPAPADTADPRLPAAGPPHSKIAELLRDPEEREKLRWLVEESTLSLQDIADQYRVAPSTIRRWVKRLGWTRRPDAPRQSVRRDGRPASSQQLAGSMDDVEAVKSRLIHAVDRQIAKIDARVRKKDATVEEKDARTLGTLAKTLETLIALDGDAGAKLQQPEPLDREQLRAALARRLAIWAEQGGQAR